MAPGEQQQYALIKKQIKDLYIGDTNILLTCLVIYKSDPKFFNFKDEQRGVLTLTLRDSVKDYLNCVIWGEEDKINEIHTSVSIGNVVAVENPKIYKELEGKSKQYQPKSSSNITLSIDARQGKITPSFDPSHTHLQSLLNHPLKSTQEVLKLSDISLYDKESVGDSVDLLVSVRFNRPPRELLIAKTGMKKKCKSIIIMDKSFQSMSLNLWSEGAIERAEKWRPLETILLITDVRVGYSEYYQAITLSETARTIFVENPRGKESEDLLKYARTTPLQDIEMSLSDDMIDGKCLFCQHMNR